MSSRHYRKAMLKDSAGSTGERSPHVCLLLRLMIKDRRKAYCKTNMRVAVKVTRHAYEQLCKLRDPAYHDGWMQELHYKEGYYVCGVEDIDEIHDLTPESRDDKKFELTTVLHKEKAEDDSGDLMLDGAVKIQRLEAFIEEQNLLIQNMRETIRTLSDFVERVDSVRREHGIHELIEMGLNAILGDASGIKYVGGP